MERPANFFAKRSNQASTFSHSFSAPFQPIKENLVENKKASRKRQMNSIRKLRWNVENNEIDDARYKLKLMPKDDIDFDVIKLAVLRTQLKGKPFLKNILKIFRVEEISEGLKLSHHKNRLLFHGTSVKNICEILKVGFRIYNSHGSREHGARFGRGFYLSPCSTVAMHYSASSTRKNQSSNDGVEYLMISEVRQFKNRCVTNPKNHRNSVNLYQAVHGVQFKYDGKDSKGRVICQGPLKKRRRNFENVTGWNVDEYVVRNPELLQPAYIIKVETTEYINR